MKKCGFIAVIAMMFCGMAGAAISNFNDTTGNHLWITPGNWSAGLPTTVNDGYIDGNRQCIIDGNMVGANKAIAYTLRVGTAAASNSSLTVIGDCNIAIAPATQGIYAATVLNNSTATINFQSGNVIAGRSIFGNGGVAYINFKGSNVTTRANSTFFAFANGTAAIDADVNMVAGTLSTGHAYLGYAGACRFNMSGGTFNTGTLTLFIGQGNATLSGASEMNVSGTAAVSATKIVVGAAASSSGKLNISGGTVVAPTVVLCEAGTTAPTGILNISSGSLTATTALKIGVVTGTGKIIMTGGTLTAGPTTLPVVPTAVADVNLVGGVMTVSSLTVNTGGYIDVKGGTLRLLGDKRTDVSTLITAGKLTGYGATRTLIVGYDGTYTIVTADILGAKYAYNYAPTSVSIFDQDSVVLSWSPGDGAVQHAIYFGSTLNDVNTATTSTTGIYKTTQTGTSYTLGADLDPGKTYYWRIDELDGSGNLIVKGRVWSFTIQNSYTVDNFESYADTPALQAAWAGSPTLDTAYLLGVGTGSALKSMTISYAPTGEATYQFATAKNFTSVGIASLYFYYHPDKGNSPALLYVKLTDSSNNSSVASLTDANLVDYWKGWQYQPVAMQQFVGTADLTSVKKISFGVSAASGIGKVNVDTIVLQMVGHFDFASLAAGDLNKDRFVDINDVATLVGDWLLSGQNIAAETVSAANLLFKYDFEDGSGTTAADSSGNGNNATMNRPGGFDAAGGIGGTGAWYSSDGSLMATVPPGALGTIAKQITVAVWVKAAVNTLPRQSVICFATASAPLTQGIFSTFGWPTSTLSGCTQLYTSYIAGVAEMTSSYNLNIPAVEGQWVHLAYVKDANEGFQRIYINGEMMAESTVTRSLAPLTGFTIGNLAALNRGFNGWMDDFRCYNRALSQGEIITLAGKTSVHQLLMKDTDINGDDSVNFLDFATMAGNWFDEILWP